MPIEFTENEMVRLPVSFDLPDGLKIKIAEAITIFSRIENMLIEILWSINNADLKAKKKIARINAKDGLMALRKFFKPPQNSEIVEAKIWDLANELADERNLIGHGTWFVDANGAATVVWHSKFLESDDFVGAEYFPNWRFERYMKRANFILEQLSYTRGILDPI
ncbi:hypothetical protein ABLE91_09920 [Aquabacter sp. CN5-332]|uniref:hypothetical protein n=1 Tax=Aquabacter sp. CN5-332 TaxID=3156608 RepID=UPI0032B59E6B